MPDNLLPSGWGLASFDERDLDAVLAGMTADVPVALRPVADVLAALRAGPVPAELDGEANAMAEFRALGLGQAEHPAGPAPTMLLEALPAGQRAAWPGRQPARHRARPSRRRPVRRATLRAAMLSAFAAAAVIMLAVLVTGNFAGSLRDIAHMASPSAGTRSSASTGHSAAPRVETTSAGLETTPPASATYSTAPTPSQICRAYYAGYLHPGLSTWVTQVSLWEQLTKLVNSKSPVQVFRYCSPYVKNLFRAGQNQVPPAPAHPGPGYQDNLGQQSGAAASSWSGSSSGQGDSQGSQPTPGP